MRLTKRSLLTLTLLTLALVFAWPTLNGYARATAFVIRAADMHGWWADPIAHIGTGPFTREDTQIETRGGRIRGRIYRPARPLRRAVLLTGGVHADGIDEPRLMKFAGELATSGTPVVTAEVPDLLRYRITPALTDTIEDAAIWTASQSSLAPDGRIGLFGISFAGGLSVAAAGRPALRDHVAFVVSLGGHGDLARVAHYLCTGQWPDGSYHRQHDYGVVVALVNLADQVVPADQVQPLRDAILIFMKASHLDMVDKTAAAREFAQARERQKALPEPAATMMKYVNDRNVQALGAILRPHVDAFADNPSLSPEIAPGINAPLFLIHGADDNVVPSIESKLLADRLGQQTQVHLLITPLITHAEVDRAAGAKDVWRLIRFWYEAFND